MPPALLTLSAATSNPFCSDVPRNAPGPVKDKIADSSSGSPAATERCGCKSATSAARATIASRRRRCVIGDLILHANSFAFMMKFGAFDHIDRGIIPTSDLYEERLRLAEA